MKSFINHNKSLRTLYSVLVSGDRVRSNDLASPCPQARKFRTRGRASKRLAPELRSPLKVPFEVYTAVVHLLKKAVLNTHHVCRGFHQEGASPPEPSPRGRASPPRAQGF